MALKLITGPVEEPVTLAEAKAHLRVDITDDDALITSLITAAREYCEGFQNRAYITQIWKLTLDDFPNMPIKIPKPPLQSVDKIEIKDEDGNITVWDPSNYVVDTDSEPGRVLLAPDGLWPSVTLYPANGIQITFTAGYGDASAVPQRVKQAILLLVAWWYEQRETVVVGSVVNQAPFAVNALLWPERVVPV